MTLCVIGGAESGAGPADDLGLFETCRTAVCAIRAAEPGARLGDDLILLGPAA